MKTIVFTILTMLAFSSLARAESTKIETIYTDLTAEKCKTLELNEGEAGSYRGECKGVGGYKLEVLEGDIRQTINVIAPNGKKSELELWSNVSSAFSAVGAKAEWRVNRVGNSIEPIALIIRYNTNEDPENVEKLTSRLVVVKIINNSACITDVIGPVRGANEKARESADASGGKPCKFGAVNQKETSGAVASTDSYAGSVRDFVDAEGEPHLIFADFADYNNAETPVWKKFGSEEELEKAREKLESYEIIYIWRKEGKVVAANFTYSSPSGDWVQYVRYVFRPDGSVATAERDLRTFMDDIIVERAYVYDERGNLLKETKNFRDLNTGNPKEEPGSFIDMDVEIFKNVSNLPFASMLSGNDGPSSAMSVAGFIPSGWRQESMATGDLNGDSISDAVLQIAVEDEEGDENDRKLIVLFKKRDGNFTKAAEAAKFMICSVCGGVKGGPAGLEIKNGVLTVSQLVGSRAFTSYLHRFRYQPSSGRFLLIGMDIDEIDGTGGSISTSTNFLTGKQNLKKMRYDERKDDDVVVSTQKKNVGKATRYIEEVEI